MVRATVCEGSLGVSPGSVKAVWEWVQGSWRQSGRESRVREGSLGGSPGSVKAVWEGVQSPWRQSGRESRNHVMWYLFRRWHRSLRRQWVNWMLMVRVHCMRHVLVIVISTWSSCYVGASTLHPRSPSAIQYTVLPLSLASGQLLM